MKKGNRRITVEISKELHTIVKIRCVRLGIPMTEWISRLIVERIEELEDKGITEGGE